MVFFCGFLWLHQSSTLKFELRRQKLNADILHLHKVNPVQKTFWLTWPDEKWILCFASAAFLEHFNEQLRNVEIMICIEIQTVIAFRCVELEDGIQSQWLSQSSASSIFHFQMHFIGTYCRSSLSYTHSCVILPAVVPWWSFVKVGRSHNCCM